MRIDNLNKVSQLYQSNSTKKALNLSSTGKSDQLEISQAGKDYQVAKQAAAAAADVRTELVNDIKGRMKAGTYQVTSGAVADKLVENYFDTIV